MKPNRDEKILTGWNGLMLAAFAEAARVLKREDYRQVAVRNADFLLGHLTNDEGRTMKEPAGICGCATPTRMDRRG